MLVLKQTDTFKKWECRLRDDRARAFIAARILRLLSGLEGDVAPVGGGVSELRIHYGPGYRIYFQKRRSEVLLLLCGGDKSTQDADIRAAKILAAEWSDPDERQNT